MSALPTVEFKERDGENCHSKASGHSSVDWGSARVSLLCAQLPLAACRFFTLEQKSQQQLQELTLEKLILPTPPYFLDGLSIGEGGFRMKDLSELYH